MVLAGSSSMASMMVRMQVRVLGPTEHPRSAIRRTCGVVVQSALALIGRFLWMLVTRWAFARLDMRPCPELSVQIKVIVN